jgi:GNAT superfamily N-acetyltransferase
MERQVTLARVIGTEDPRLLYVLALLSDCVLERRRGRGDLPPWEETQPHRFVEYPALFRFLTSWACEVFLIESSGRAAGLVMAERFEDDPDGVWMAREFYVDPAHRGLGLASEALRHLGERFPGRWYLLVSATDTDTLAMLAHLETTGRLRGLNYRWHRDDSERVVVDAILGLPGRTLLATGSRLSSPRLRCPPLAESGSRLRWAVSRSG